MRFRIAFLLVLLLSSFMMKAQIISGTLSVCAGSTTSLSGTPTGGTWVSSAPAIASVSTSGLVSGFAPGVAVITYTYSGTPVTASVTVYPLPLPVTGTFSVCVGSSTTLASASPGGLWSVTGTHATVDPSSGDVIGISAGTSTIIYTNTSGCSTSSIVTVNPLPASITGVPPGGLCAGTSATLSCATAGGTWSSSNLSVGTVSTSGAVLGLSAGTTNIYYTIITGCATFATVTVNPLPAPITGASAVCAGNSTSMTDVTVGGTWYSTATTVATVGVTGSVTGMAAGSANIVYQLPTGCNTIKPVTVNPLPAVISGTYNMCTGSVATMSTTPAGGLWSTTTPAIISIGTSSGTVNALTSGIGTMVYTLPATGCITSRNVTINATPGPITGMAAVCPGGTLTLSNAVGGGVWLSDTTTVATVGTGTGSTTTLTGITGGTANISYVIGGICITVAVATVNPSPAAGSLSGATSLCAGATTTLASTVPGGTWSSSATSIGTINPTSGAFSAIAPGTTSITYTVSSVCGTATATMNITVSVAPTAITGSLVFCRGTNTTLTNSVSGGTWSTGASYVASVGSSTGVVSGIGAGTATVFYSMSSGCFVTVVVTVNPAPGPIGGGATNLCVGAVLALTDTAAGGIWGSSSTSIATIATVGGSTSVVTGISAGVVTMTYAIGSCMATTSITVNPLPSVTSTSVPDACGGSSTLNGSGVGIVSYTWSPATGLSCTACATTVANPASTTTYTVTATDGLGCAGATTVTVNGDRIYGHISFSAAPPSIPDLKVWLIQFNPSDSSITATDSAVTCFDGTGNYYAFNSKPVGNYFVKAKLNSSIPGISGYIPTYSSSTANWFSAVAAVHTVGAGNVMDINMIYGTVPSGPGFIGGYVYAGAGKGTAGEVPEAGMLIYLKDATTGQVLTHTYTNAMGMYSFGSIALGNYIIYPEDYDYYTTPSTVISLSAGSTAMSDVTFKKHTVLHTIYPFSTNAVDVVNCKQTGLVLFPDPASEFVNISWDHLANDDAEINIADMAGRSVLTEHITASNNDPVRIDIAALSAGVYFVNVRSAIGNYTARLIVE